jgi:hypothetical protein
MAETTFDPGHAVRFDLARGTVHKGEADARHVLVPLSALAAGSVEAVGRAIGASIGARVLSSLGSAEGVRGTTLEAFATALGGELALSGFGMASVERWGRAMVVAIESPGAEDALLAAILESALEGAAGRKVRATRLMRDAGAARFLVSNEGAGDRVAKWINEGTAWGEALARLHGGSAS